MNDEQETKPADARSVCEQKLQYFKALAQRLCKHQWVALESKDGTVSKFCPVCTLVKDDI